jgi:CubicO group peptidase (beta-lactamase class C family)
LTIAFTSMAFGLLSAVSATAQDLPTAKPEEVGVSSAKVEELSKFMQSLVDEGKIAGGVTMMARHGKVIHLKAAGMADREERKLMRTDSIFRIASMTKPVTSVAIMMLSDEGKLGLDDPVSKYISEFKNTEVLVSVEPLETRPAKREITIRHLLTHTSGIGYNFTAKVGPIYNKHGISGGLCHVTETPVGDMMKRLARLPLLFDPGDGWEYGLSTDVLGSVVEEASKMPLDRFIDERICQPLRMTDTFFKVPAEKKKRLVAACYSTEDGIKKLDDGESLPDGQRPDYPYHASHNYFSGGGGLCSTATDYMRFCQMLLNGGELNGQRLLKEDTVRMMTANHIGQFAIPWLPDKFGLGFSVIPDTKEFHEQLRGAYAWAGFWSTSFRISPRGDWIVITMSQLAWDFKFTPAWLSQYETIAAKAIEN